MSIQDVIKGKKEWQAHMARVKMLPHDYRVVYKEIQKYLFKVGPSQLTEGIELLSEIVGLFEESAALRKSVFEVTSKDVAAFCDEFIKDSKTYVDVYQKSAKQEDNEAIKKVSDKNKMNF